MKKTLSIMIWILLFGMDATYAQFIQNSSRSLFSDVKAFKSGDAIMVLIMEDTQANNGATTNENRSTSLSGGLNLTTPSSSPQYGGTLNTGNVFQGQATTSRNETINSRLSARVIQVDSINGNLRIEGTRTTKINGETQTIVIKGYVRPVDVLPNNSVYSYSILDLTLLIEGNGTVTKSQEPGFITKFLRMLF